MKKQILALFTVSALALAACGGSATNDTASPTLSASPSASVDTGAATPGMGGGSTVIGPIILDTGATSGELIVGQTATFDLENPGDWTLAADAPELVNLTAGGDQGGYTTLPGATALAVGTVIVTLTNTVSGDEIAFTLTIK